MVYAFHFCFMSGNVFSEKQQKNKTKQFQVNLIHNIYCRICLDNGRMADCFSIYSFVTCKASSIRPLTLFCCSKCDSSFPSDPGERHFFVSYLIGVRRVSLFSYTWNGMRRESPMTQATDVPVLCWFGSAGCTEHTCHIFAFTDQHNGCCFLSLSSLRHRLSVGICFSQRYVEKDPDLFAHYCCWLIRWRYAH